MLRLGLLVACVAIVSAYLEEFEGHAVLRLVPRSTDHLKALTHLGKEVGFEVDYLRTPRSVDRPADIVLASRHLNKTQEFLDKHRVPNWVLEDNFAAVVHREKRAVLNLPDPDAEISKHMIMTHYLSFDAQIRVMNQLAAALPGLVRLEQLGTSTEGRPIMAAFVGIPSNLTKPIFWFDAGIHAREWIAPASALYALWEYATNPQHYDLLRRIDIVIAPNVNPDGYEYSRLYQRMWRKTRSKTTRGRCPGVDGNRNYPFHWGEEGVSYAPCSEQFCGPNAASEPEVKSLIDAITARKDRVRGYVALHSYGQDILYPWGHTTNAYPDDVEDLKAVALEMAKAIKDVRGTEYNVANSGDGLYPASGAGDDWAKSIGIKYTYTMELSPIDDIVGFQLPEKYIAQTVTETFAGLNVLAKKIGQGPFRRRIFRTLRRG